MPSFGSTFWKHLGNEGAQFLYLGMGVILMMAGISPIEKNCPEQRRLPG
jgi:hypothetical protein